MARMIRILIGAVAGLALLGATASEAAIVNAPLPSNTFITLNGFDWAWASPLPSGHPSAGFDLSFQSQFGWRLPTVDELAFAPDATDFMFTGANVPLGGNDPVTGAWFSATNSNLVGAAACAAPYFNTLIIAGPAIHCDWQDGNGQPNGPWFGLPGAPGNGDQLAVRTIIPLPAAAWLFIGGIGLVGAAAWRRCRAA